MGDRVVFRAGLELPLLHFGLLCASLPVRAGILPSLLPFAGGFRRVAGLLRRFGTDRGGMLVEAQGADAEDVPVHACWVLIAEAGDGPVVPTLPALAVLRKLAQGDVAAGAHLGAEIVDLAAIEREFAPYHIGVRQDAQRAPSPFRRILGDEGMAALPAPVRRLHTLSQRCDVAGRAEITVARGLLPWLLCKFAGLPQPGKEVPVAVSFRPDGNGRERWRRQFAERRYRSTMQAGQGAEAGLLIERFEPFDLRFRLTPADGGLDWRLVGWRVRRLPLPVWAMPQVRCRETGDGPRFVFDIDVRFPLIGPVIHYRGWLLPVEGEAAQASAA